ncbi:haloacid dehalogenase [Pseudovirgaria hyperparasitica]|uniref:Haloacid dehalogenase n=1 Tax=Pseudovirgaria hyperparasitica TaxID=470096 RepID=A0A6A6W2I8_9PEZI|nr:haloacid dehalogenase [Pseudovirgaria hyperparasitica]KAF2755807.1 haloacid dehalogenase [Pseudovirgaria hyperparasitica]
MVLTHAPRALLFDIFGTCVNWRNTVTRVLNDTVRLRLSDATASLATSVRIRASDMTIERWGDFAQEWHNAYYHFTQSVAAKPTATWKSVDEHHHESLRGLLEKWQLVGLYDDEQIRALSLVWHSLDAWADSSAGVTELNKYFWTVTLSNGNTSLLSDLKTHAQIPFTHVFSAEDFGAYKPNQGIYLGAVHKLGLQPKDCAMVAAHLADLKAAKSCGLQTIYVERPHEEAWTDDQIEAAKKDGFVDLWVASDEEGFIAVAERLGIEVDRTRKRSRST